jgi:uncharacterized Tic20 family protein
MSSYPPPEDPREPTQRLGAPEPRSDERNWAMSAHVLSVVSAWFALGLFAPLVVLLVKGNDSGFVRRHAVESLNFQINALVYTVVFALLIFVGIGLVLLPLYGLFYLACVITGGVRASSGRDYRYPLTLRFVR